mgnify:CR=1 FL=1
MRYLLDNGADKDLQDKRGDTALHHSTRYLRFDVNVALNEAGARMDIVNNDGETHLQLAEQSMATKQKQKLDPTADAEIKGKDQEDSMRTRNASTANPGSSLGGDAIHMRRQAEWAQRLYEEATYGDDEFAYSYDMGGAFGDDFDGSSRHQAGSDPYEDDGYRGEAWRDDLHEQMEARIRERYPSLAEVSSDGILALPHCLVALRVVVKRTPSTCLSCTTGFTANS